MPKKAVAIFFLLALFGAGLFIYVTFPRTKDEIPKSNNQQPLIPRPAPSTPNVPNGVPVPESQPHPNTPKPPPGPTLHVMAWASAAEAYRLTADTDSFTAATGRQISLTIEGDLASYRRDLQQAFETGAPPDLCLISSRDFCGLDPAQDLADVTPVDATPPRAVDAFTVNDRLKAVPDEFAVQVLFYNPALFDQAGIGYPGTHWTWDVFENDARAITALKLKDAQGHPVYAVESPADFDLWNILCAEAGAPALDLGTWHLADAAAKNAQMRGLELVREMFHEYAITPPATGKTPSSPGQLFSQGRVALLIGPSYLVATWPATFRPGISVLPRDLVPATLASVNGWAVAAKSTQTEAALDLAQYLTDRAVHAGWTSIQPAPPGVGDDSPAVVCRQAFTRAIVPRFDDATARMAHYLDQQLALLAHSPDQTPEILYAKIQAQLQAPSAPDEVRYGMPPHAGPTPSPKADISSQLRGL